MVGVVRCFRRRLRDTRSKRCPLAKTRVSTSRSLPSGGTGTKTTRLPLASSAAIPIAKELAPSMNAKLGARLT